MTKSTNSKLLLTLSILAIMRDYGISHSYAATVSQAEIEVKSKQSEESVTEPHEERSTTLDTVVIEAKKDVMQSGNSAEDIYDKNESSTFKSKKEIERFLGESPSDILKGMVGVQSGDARNSGAIDPNVRGIQGQGRVPVTIDGGQQAVTVYRGYAGANNRNYIDPLLISDIKVSKGASMERGVQSSVGGAVTINTLNVDDIIEEGKSFGMNFKGTIGNNTTSESALDLSDGDIYLGDTSFDENPIYIGYNPDMQDRPNDKKYAQTMYDLYMNNTGDVPRENIFGIGSQKPEKRGNALEGDDVAYRIAMAGRADIDIGADSTIKIDGLAAYTNRDRGNYFAGEHGSDDYTTDLQPYEHETGDFGSYMADVYRPGMEVLNTSNSTESYLLKGTIRPSDDQALQLGVRHTETIYGDIMPSRVENGHKDGIYSRTGRLPQWPLSTVELDSYNLRYRFDPEDNPWINIHSNLWRTESKLYTNNSGGYPYLPELKGLVFRNTVDPDVFRADVIAKYKDKYPDVANCSYEEMAEPPWDWPPSRCWLLGSLYYENTVSPGDSYKTTYNDRNGFSLSNTSEVTDKLDFSLSGNWQEEEVSTDPIKDVIGVGFVAIQRQGRREAWDVSASFDYRPTDKLQIQAGVTYNNYWALDDLITERRKIGRMPNKVFQTYAYKLRYYEVADQRIQDKLAEVHSGNLSYYEYMNFIKTEFPTIDTNRGNSLLGTKKAVANIENGQEGVAYVNKEYIWEADSKGNVSKDNNPFLNGEAQEKGWLRPVILTDRGTGSGSASALKKNVTVGDPFKPAKKHEAHAYSPSLAVSYQITPEQRVYARYVQSTRMPSLYESTVGFSIQSLDNDNPVKPEKGTSAELGYVVDLTKWLTNADFADIKLAYYHNRIDDIIDRTTEFKLKNFDHQTIQGIELQSRYDNGDWFADFSVSHTLKQEVCDASYAAIEDPYYAQVPDCVKYGFSYGYLQNMGQPDWQSDLVLGTRLLEDKLVLGTRLHYHSGADKELNAKNYGVSNQRISNFNTPLDWSSVMTLDGFLSYKVNKHLNLELAGTNLTNQYYIDPLSRTLMPAPGRAMTLKAEVAF